jgi:predicted transcriptional regulator
VAWIPPQLAEISKQIEDGQRDSTTATPREILAWFSYYRRTWRQARLVRAAFDELRLITAPDFDGAGFDELVYISRATVKSETTTTTTPAPSASTIVSAADGKQDSAVDPVHRVSRFLPSTSLVSVTRDERLAVAVTKMMMHDYSQLPVMQGDRKVDGVISWKTIGSRLALGVKVDFVRDCVEPQTEVNSDDSIFDAIRMIQAHDCVLVRAGDQRIVGIVTATDISNSFEQVSRPFLLLSYIENHLRMLIRSRFDTSALQAAKDPADINRTISDVSDMTFGEYIRLLEVPENWQRLGIGIERTIFVQQLNEVREIRNDVMHFNPEGIEEKDLESLRRYNTFLESIVELVA